MAVVIVCGSQNGSYSWLWTLRITVIGGVGSLEWQEWSWWVKEWLENELVDLRKAGASRSEGCRSRV